MASSSPPPAPSDRQQRQQTTSKLPKEIVDYYSRHGVESVEEANATHRFVRLNPRYGKEETLSLLQKEVATRAGTANDDNSSPFPLQVPWLNGRLGFYALPADFGLAGSDCFRTGRVYGMDISSGAAVAALLYDDHDDAKPQKKNAACTSLRVLDLCCSPGLKLCAISDLLSNDSTVVGVDISESRISLCKKIITKYQINRPTSRSSTCTRFAEDADNSSARIRLYCQDGTQFGLSSFRHDEKLVFDSEIAREDELVVAGKRKRMNKSARARQQKRLRTVAHLDFVDDATAMQKGDVGCHLFDRVLVDAECSTDGAIKHLKHKLKQEQSNADGSGRQGVSAVSKSGISKLGDADAMADLVDLQRRLMLSGFRLLKRGGILVYSTCSLSEQQNEGVVNWFLQQCPDAFITPVTFETVSHGNADDVKEENFLISEGTISGTVRFRPKLQCQSNERDNANTSSMDTLLFGGGFWLAKIGKR